jgi:hypothetical protein
MPDKAVDRKPGPQPGDWDDSWEANRRHQFSAGLAATPAQRLAWLEEALAVAYQSGALPRGRQNT